MVNHYYGNDIFLHSLTSVSDSFFSGISVLMLVVLKAVTKICIHFNLRNYLSAFV